LVRLGRSYNELGCERGSCFFLLVCLASQGRGKATFLPELAVRLPRVLCSRVTARCDLRSAKTEAHRRSPRGWFLRPPGPHPVSALQPLETLRYRDVRRIAAAGTHLGRESPHACITHIDVRSSTPMCIDQHRWRSPSIPPPLDAPHDLAGSMHPPVSVSSGGLGLNRMLGIARSGPTTMGAPTVPRAQSATARD
jgi:hypothetical protein